jgi:hypothetical protein
MHDTAFPFAGEALLVHYGRHLSHCLVQHHGSASTVTSETVMPNTESCIPAHSSVARAASAHKQHKANFTNNVATR